MIDLDIKLELGCNFLEYRFKSDVNRTVVFGPSGSGKTTLLKAIAGFYKPLSGFIKVNGKVFYDSSNKINIPVYERKLGFVPQDDSVFPNMTVQKNILYGKNKIDNDSKKRFQYITNRLQISDKLNEYSCTLSEGQKKRVALARVFMIEPDIMLLDEPFTALDGPIRECLRGFVMEISEELNIPVLFVSHNIESSFSLGDNIVIVDSGKVIEYGKLSEVYSKPAKRTTARLLDFKNVWRITEVYERGITALCENSYLNIAVSRRPDNAGFVCIRPEKIKINSALLDDDNCFTGVVESVHLRGHYFRVCIRIDDFFVISHVAESDIAGVKRGFEVSVSFSSSDFVFCH